MRKQNPMASVVVALASIAGIAGQPAMFGQALLAIPSWLVSYPGATAKTRAAAGYFESTYETVAKPEAVVGHYQKLFEAQGLLFQPNFDGMGTAIRGEARECDLLLLIRRRGAGSWVQVSGAVRSPVKVSTQRIETVPAPRRPPATTSIEERKAEQQEHTRQVLKRAEEKHKEQIRGMEKYDQPVYPRPKGPPPSLAWPSWLVQPDGTPLEIQKGVDQFGRKFAKASFMTDRPRARIHAFYADLLTANGYPIRMQSIASAPADRKGLLEGEHYLSGSSGSRILIRVELMPVGEVVRVELRMTAYP